MGVYIKGMELPVTCWHCPLMGYCPDVEWTDSGRCVHGAYICAITHERSDNTKREEHCPLVHVQPHGRLIDARALHTAGYEVFEKYADKPDAREALKEIEKLIIGAPTIIPAEVEEK